MKLTPLGPNQTEVEIRSTLKVLFSYSTPVACFIPGKGYFVTTYKWSRTTTRHINKWVDGNSATPQPQEFFDNLLESEE